MIQKKYQYKNYLFYQFPNSAMQKWTATKVKHGNTKEIEDLGNLVNNFCLGQ